MELTVENTFAAPVIPGVEDKFYYVISEDCVMCASCMSAHWAFPNRFEEAVLWHKSERVLLSIRLTGANAISIPAAP